MIDYLSKYQLFIQDFTLDEIEDSCISLFLFSLRSKLSSEVAFSRDPSFVEISRCKD